MMKRALLFALLLAAPAFVAAQTDLTGTWSGAFNITMDGESHPDTAYMVLKQKGADLTGTVGPDESKQWPVLNGKVAGQAATFDVQSDGPLVHFTLKLVEGHLKGDANAEQDGHKLSATVDVERKK